MRHVNPDRLQPPEGPLAGQLTSARRRGPDRREARHRALAGWRGLGHHPQMANRSGSRPRDREATEAAIVAAAERLLLRDGWSGLNVNTLAAEAGVDRKLIYRYFEGVEGVVERVAGRLDLWLGETLAALPPSQATSYRAFARETLLAYLRALRSGPLILRIVAWELSVDTPLLRRLEAARSGVLQEWMVSRRPHLPLPQGVDVVALNVTLLAAVQHLALAAASRGRLAGVALDDDGWARIEAALDRLLEAWPA